MASTTFDTLAYSNRLQKAGMPREQAEAIVEANAEALKDMMAAHDLVTKKDLALGLAETRHEILKWMVTAMITQTALLVAIIAFLR